MNKNIKIIFKYIIAPTLAVWLFYSLYQQIRTQPDLHKSLGLMTDAPFGSQAWKFWSVILLIFFNWGFEARKWQVVAGLIQKINFFTAFKSVLAGTTFSINTPNRIGEYGGRILYIEEGKRLKAISLSIASSMSQLIITLLLGSAGLGYFLLFQIRERDQLMGLSHFWIEILLMASLIFSFCLIIFFFRLSWLIKIIEKISSMKKYIQYINVLEEFSLNLLLRLLCLSFFRYLVFVIQYLLLLQVLDVQLHWITGFWVVSILFLVLAIVPSFAIADLGIRGKFSTALFSLFSSNTVGIVGTTFGIWFLNLFIPAFIGSILILGIKFFNDK